MSSLLKNLSFHPTHGGHFHVSHGLASLPVWNPEFLNYLSANHSIGANDIVITSYFKTGTHWLKKILLEIMRHSNSTKNCKRFNSIDIAHNFPNIDGGDVIFNGINGWIEWYNNCNIDGYPVLYHSHQCYSMFTKMNISPKSKLIYIMRNPKDVSVSMHFFNVSLPFMNYSGDISTSMQLFLAGLTQCDDYWDHIVSWNKNSLNLNNILFIYYEDLIKNSMVEIKKIAKFIEKDHDLNDNDYIDINHKCLIKNVVKEYNENPGNFYENHELYPNQFFRKGKINDWENYFTEEMSHYYNCKTLIKFSEIPYNLYYKELVKEQSYNLNK